MIAVAKAATVPFRILAIGAIPLSLPRGGVDMPALRGPLPACYPPTRAVAVTQSRSRRIGSGADEFGSAHRGSDPVMMLGDK